MSALLAHKKYGVHKNLLHHNIVNYFHLDKECQSCLWNYYVLHWERRYLSEQIVNGTIKRDGREFIVIYSCCGASDLHKDGDVRVSFRVPQPEYNLKNYVIVKLWD